MHFLAATLYRHFLENKIEVITKVQSIEKVKILDRGLTRIFWLVAIIGYASLSYIINFVFAADLRLGEKICFLPNEYFVIAFIATTIAAAISSLLAAWKTTSIAPAEAIREE